MFNLGLFLCNRLLSRSVYIFVSASIIEIKCSKSVSRAVVCYWSLLRQTIKIRVEIQAFWLVYENLWSYLRERCSSFQARDCNASFSQIFEEKTFGQLNPDEVSLFATQRLFESYCPTCNKNVNLNSNIFLTCVSQSGLEKSRYDKILWPLYVSSIHTQPGKLRCGNCRSLTHEPWQHL